MAREPGVEDATRRTRLANERTYLAWWRTGLTSLAVCIGVGKLVPGVTKHVTKWPYEIVGAGFGVLGVGFIVIAHHRARVVEDALDRGSFAPFGRDLSLTLVVAGALLGLATVALIVFVR